MKIDVQRLRNLTTGRLHTKIGDIYQDLEMIIGEEGIMTHMIPRVMQSIEPWLRVHVTEPRFWNGEWDTEHTGVVDIPQPSEVERAEMFERFKAMPNPLDGKVVIGVQL